MFKKKNLKKDNVLENVLKTGDGEDPNSEEDANEPVVKKKTKRVDFKYSVRYFSIVILRQKLKQKNMKRL